MTKLFFCLAILTLLGSCQPDIKTEINSHMASLQAQITASKTLLENRADAIAHFSTVSDSIKKLNKYDSLLAMQKQQILELGDLEIALKTLKDSLVGL